MFSGGEAHSYLGSCLSLNSTSSIPFPARDAFPSLVPFPPPIPLCPAWDRPLPVSESAYHPDSCLLSPRTPGPCPLLLLWRVLGGPGLCAICP